MRRLDLAVQRYRALPWLLRYVVLGRCLWHIEPWQQWITPVRAGDRQRFACWLRTGERQWLDI